MIYKFRSMYLDAEERKQELMEQNRVEDGMMFKLRSSTLVLSAAKSVLMHPQAIYKKGVGNYIRDWSLTIMISHSSSTYSKVI